MRCSVCGKYLKRIYPDETCQACYNYFRWGGEIHPVPPMGVISKDERGRVICHICGMSFKRLGSHVRESHSMTIEEYKDLFGLCRSARTTEKTYSDRMRQIARENKMPEQLITTGTKTRFQKGDKTSRLGKPVRLQEIIDKKNRRRSDG